MSQGGVYKEQQKRELKVKRKKLDQNTEKGGLEDIYGAILPPGGQKKKTADDYFTGWQKS